MRQEANVDAESKSLEVKGKEGERKEEILRMEQGQKEEVPDFMESQTQTSPYVRKTQIMCMWKLKGLNPRSISVSNMIPSNRKPRRNKAKRHG